MFPALGCAAALTKPRSANLVLVGFYGLGCFSAPMLQVSTPSVLPQVMEILFSSLYSCPVPNKQVKPHWWSAVANGELIPKVVHSREGRLGWLKSKAVQDLPLEGKDLVSCTVRSQQWNWVKETGFLVFGVLATGQSCCCFCSPCHMIVNRWSL